MARKNELAMPSEKSAQGVDGNIEAILSKQVSRFISVAAPYLEVENINSLVDKNTANTLNGFEFFSLKSCTAEKVENLAAFLNEKIEKLFTALYSLQSPLVYGVVSRGGKTKIIIGVKNGASKPIIQSMIKGLLIGIEIEDCGAGSLYFGTCLNKGKGGFISAVPVLKIGDDKQKFDLSTLMRSLNGQDYTVLFYAKPIPQEKTQENYSAILNVRDTCAAVSKRNISKSENTNDNITKTHSMSGRGFVAEAVKQVRDKKFSFSGLLDSLEIGGRENYSTAEMTAIKGLTEGISYDVQNGVALEMVEFCDKAIERFKQGQSIGLWDVTISYAASGINADVLSVCLCGEIAKPSTDLLPMAKFDYALGKGQSIYLPNDDGKKLLVPITSAELGMLCTPPADVVPDFELKEGKNFPLVGLSCENGVPIGKVSDGHRSLENMDFALSEKDLNKHTFVCGITGSGKTTTVKEIIRNCNKPFMVIESAKKEYRSILLKQGRQKPTVYTLGKPEINCYQLNPFYVQCGINLQTHIDFLKDLFNAAFSFYGPMPYILEKCLFNVYKKKGWNLTLGYHPYLINIEDKTDLFNLERMQKQYERKAAKYLFPTMQDLKDEIKRYIEKEMQYEGEVAGNIKTAILARLESLCVGAKGYMFNTNTVPNMKALMEQDVVFELEGLADDSDKAFSVGLLVVFINEYRQISKEIQPGDGLKHLLVIEEAHRLLKNVSTEKASEESANPQGKAVEHFTNMIAEMRSYGQGVIIAEQIPSKLAPDVIKNSSNKIIQRVVSADDQELVANTIGMKREDAVYLGSLKTGMGLCHKEGMNLPAYVKIQEPDKETPVTDKDIHIPNASNTFYAIDYCVIKENTADIIEEAAFKTLNSLLASSPDDVIRDIEIAVSSMMSALKQRDIGLIADRLEVKPIYRAVLLDRVVSYLAAGVYSVKKLFWTDNLMNTLSALFKSCLPEDVKTVQELLSKAESGYGESCAGRCVRIVANSILNDFSKDMNLLNTIKAYFFVVPDGFEEKIVITLEEYNNRGEDF